MCLKLVSVGEFTMLSNNYLKYAALPNAESILHELHFHRWPSLDCLAETCMDMSFLNLSHVYIVWINPNDLGYKAIVWGLERFSVIVNMSGAE